MSSITLTFDLYDQAIIRALRKHPQGIRNTKLNHESQIDGKTINVKTYNKHLKRLVSEGVVERVEEGRARVIYKLHLTAAEKQMRRLLKWGIEYFVVKELLSLYEHRKEINGHQAQKEFNKIISDGALRPIRNIFVFAVSTAIKDSNPVDFSLSINEETEFFREGAIAMSKVIEQNQETRAFFYPLLENAFA